jgi:hypothetical protein
VTPIVLVCFTTWRFEEACQARIMNLFPKITKFADIRPPFFLGGVLEDVRVSIEPFSFSGLTQRAQIEA